MVRITLVLILLPLGNDRCVLGMTLPVEGLPSYSEFPSDEDETPMTSDPRSWYSTTYCGKYLGHWYGRGEGSGSHPGVDIRVSIGTPVRAIAPGKVLGTGFMWRWGNTVVIQHNNMPGIRKGEPIYSIYAHLSKILVKIGGEVEEGDVIGLSGDTGIIQVPHLHFQIDKYTEDGQHPFFPSRRGQCTRCEWLNPRHVVNNPDTDYQVRRHTINPIRYVLQFKNYQPEDSKKPLKKNLAVFEERELYKGSGQEIYLYLDGSLHLIPDLPTLYVLGVCDLSNKVKEIPDQVLFTIPHLQDIPPLHDGCLIRAINDDDVYIIQEHWKKPLHLQEATPGKGNNRTEILLVPEWILEYIPTMY